MRKRGTMTIDFSLLARLNSALIFFCFRQIKSLEDKAAKSKEEFGRWVPILITFKVETKEPSSFMIQFSFLQKTSCGNPKEVITNGDQF